MIGNKYNMLTVISFSHIDKWRSKYFHCKCECGVEKTVKGSFIKTGKTKSCGCLAKDRMSKYAKENSYRNIKNYISDIKKSHNSFIFNDNYDLSLKNFIYKLTNTVNGKVYIGQTSICLKKHLHRYNRITRSKSDKNRIISKAIKKYGHSSFLFDIIELCTIDILNEREIYYILLYDSKNLDKGYNMTDGGDAMRGLIFTEDHRKNIGNSRRGKYTGENNPFYGKTHNTETREKIIESNKRRKGGKNKKMSEDTKNNISKALKGKTTGEKNGKSKWWLLISPEGIEYKICGGLKPFCEKHGIPNKYYVKLVIDGIKNDYNGWIIKKYEKVG